MALIDVDIQFSWGEHPGLSGRPDWCRMAGQGFFFRRKEREGSKKASWHPPALLACNLDSDKESKSGMRKTWKMQHQLSLFHTLKHAYSCVGKQQIKQYSHVV